MKTLMMMLIISMIFLSCEKEPNELVNKNKIYELSFEIDRMIIDDNTKLEVSIIRSEAIGRIDSVKYFSNRYLVYNTYDFFPKSTEPIGIGNNSQRRNSEGYIIDNSSITSMSGDYIKIEFIYETIPEWSVVRMLDGGIVIDSFLISSYDNYKTYNKNIKEIILE